MTAILLANPPEFILNSSAVLSAICSPFLALITVLKVQVPKTPYVMFESYLYLSEYRTRSSHIRFVLYGLPLMLVTNNAVMSSANVNKPFVENVPTFGVVTSAFVLLTHINSLA